MNTMIDMLTGAGFEVATTDGNRADVTIGGNNATIIMEDPERDPIGKCKVITDDAVLEFLTIYDAAIYVDGIGKNAKEIHYFYERYIVVNPDISCVVYTSDSLDECKAYVEDQLNPPEPLTETTRYNIIDTSEEADHPWWVTRYVKEVTKKTADIEDLAAELREMVTLGWEKQEAYDNKDGFIDRIGEVGEEFTEEEIFRTWENVWEQIEDEMTN